MTNPADQLSRKPKSRKKAIFFAIILPLIWVVGGTLIFANFQNIRDALTAWQYPLDAQVKTLATEAGLNSRGDYLLQISRAQLDDSASFNANCQIKETQAILLGCYSGQRIYVFNVTDSQISGIKSVIAAHEMLHAAYQRLSSTERNRVDAMISAEIPHIQNPEILDLLKVYAKSEPGQELNELHSLLATEEKSLPSDLENYYKQYFTDRQKVVANYDAYKQVFDNLNSQAQNLQNQLANEKTAIQKATNDYLTNSRKLSSDIDDFNNCAKTTGCFANQADFAAQRAALISRQNQLATDKTALDAQVDKYNKDVAALNALGVEAQKLNQNLDSQSQSLAD